MRVVLCILIAICAIDASAHNYVFDLKKTYQPFLRRSHSVNIPITNTSHPHIDANFTNAK